MSYLVLARKWRPETFAEVVGQKHVVLTLAAAVETDRVAHAHLFAGPRGVGKTTVARILAKSLNCEQGPPGEPCGKCGSCEEIAAGRSLDVIEIDGASNRKIEDARGIRETVQYAPLSGRMKVYIIDEAHMLTREAFNALLKTLEEPPPHVVFVLATTEPGKIPETIASRCQRFDFHRIAASEIEVRLAEIAGAEKIDVEEGAMKLVASRADGSMRDAVSLLDQLISVGRGKVTSDDVARVLGIPDSDVYFALSDAVADHETGATLGVLEGALDSGFDARDLLDGFVEHLRNLLLVRSAPDPDRLVGRIAEYRGHVGPSGSVGEDDLVRLVRIGVEAQAAAKWSTQPGLIVELALLRMAKLSRTVDLEDVLKAVRGDQGGGDPPAGGSAGGGRAKERESDTRSAKKKHAPPGSKAAASRPPRAVGAQGTSSEPVRAASATGSGAASLAAATAVAAAASEPAECPPEVCPERWPDVLTKIREERPSLAASLADAVPSAHDGGRLGLRVPNGSSFHRDQFEDRANMSLMERAASDVFGGPVRVRLEFGESPGARAADGAPTGARDEGGDDPMVQKVMEIFDGRIMTREREE
ncbi:MAG: DNA polymerase III subunit gamma/tau [Candidatus Eisenbacteria bacterium]